MRNHSESKEKMTYQEFAEERGRFPAGIIVLLCLVGLVLVRSMIALNSPVVLIGTLRLEGIAALMYQLTVITVVALLFTGIIQRKRWARTLGMGCLVYTVAFATISSMLFFADTEKIVSSHYDAVKAGLETDTFRMTMMFSTGGGIALAWTVGGVFLWYLHREKRFFSL